MPVYKNPRIAVHSICIDSTEPCCDSHYVAIFVNYMHVGLGWAVVMYFANYIQVLVGTAHPTCRSKI